MMLRSEAPSRFAGSGALKNPRAPRASAPAAGTARKNRRRTSRRYRSSRCCCGCGRLRPAEIEKLRRCRSRDGEQKCDRDRHRDQRSGFGKHPEKRFSLGHALWVETGKSSCRHTSGIGPQAGGLWGHKPAIGRRRQGWRRNLRFRVTGRAGTGAGTPERVPNQCPLSFSSTSEEANPSAGAPMEAWKLRSASRVWPPNWPSGVPL